MLVCLDDDLFVLVVVFVHLCPGDGWRDLFLFAVVCFTLGCGFDFAFGVGVVSGVRFLALCVIGRQCLYSDFELLLLVAGTKLGKATMTNLKRFDYFW